MIWLPIFFSIVLANSPGPKVSKERQDIGPVYSTPLVYKNRMIFLASTGSLYESTLLQTKIKSLFRTKLSTIAQPIIYKDIVYFGDGLHDDKESNLYAYDLKKNKILFTQTVPGHIEKSVRISGNKIVTGLGPAGVGAFDLATGKPLWHTKSHDGKPLHVDSAPIIEGDKFYIGSIYASKAIMALKVSDGSVIWSTPTLKSPKMDLALHGNKLIGLSTEAGLMSEKRDIPADFVVVDKNSGNVLLQKELRGANFFPQLILDNEVFVSLMTGDLVMLNIDSGAIRVVDQYPEPFIASTFLASGAVCAVSYMGRLACYKNGKSSIKKDLGEQVIGRISSKIGGNFYLPTRMGYYILNL